MTDRLRYPRSSCCVPFCRRTTAAFPPGHEWVCGEHWRLVDRALKALRRKFRLRYERRWSASTFDLIAAQAGRYVDEYIRDPTWQREYATHCAIDRQWSTFERGIWRRMKRQAIERATGVTA